MTPDKPLLTRKQLAAHLRQAGYPIGDSTLTKLCLPSNGQGPAPAAYWFRRPLYDPDEGIAWAAARLTKSPNAALIVGQDRPARVREPELERE